MPRILLSLIIVEYNNYVSQLNLFKNDMAIPILNFLSLSQMKNTKKNNKFFINKYNDLKFQEVNYEVFPI